ncbi:MAG: hypothetical protein GY769_01655 [bacterium]|nr:hypothetical protein [bacterium]
MPNNPRRLSQGVTALLAALALSSPLPAQSAAAEAGADPARIPDFVLTDQHGSAFGTRQLEGRVWIANLVFTRCRGTCSELTRRMTRLQAELFNHPDWGDIRLVTFTTDPEHDTAERLLNFSRTNAYAYDSHWRFLTGARDDLSRFFEIGLRLEPASGDAGPIAHSQMFTLVDRDGSLRGHYEVLEPSGWRDLLAEIESALREPWSGTREPEPRLPEVAHPRPTPDMPWLEAADPTWLEPRRRAQLASADQIGAFHGFRFTDRIAESGISFLNRVVDDGGLVYKGVHYDHGNGVAVADVDADGLYDLYLTTQLGRNGLWKNVGGGRFADITEQAGVGLGNRISVAASFADTDNDGDPDLMVTTVRDGNVLFENDGTGRFRDISASAGVDYSGHSSGVVFFDYDLDGRLDLFVSNVGIYTGDDRGRGGYYIGFTDAFSGHLYPNRTERSILYKNLGENRFQDATAATRLLDDSWTGDASPIDLNTDGYPDLYVLDMQGNDDYFENVRGEYFERKSREVFPLTPWGSMGIKVFDVDNDGLMDIFLSDMHSDMSEMIGPEREKLKSRMRWSPAALGADAKSIFGNALFRNLGEGRFKEVSDRMGSENYWPWGFSVSDLNADGFDDVFLTSSMNFPWRYGVNTVLLNDKGERFHDAEFILGVEPRKGGRTTTPWFELDCSGDLTKHPLYAPICAGRTERIEVQGALGSRSSVIFDLDDDGDLDIVTNDFNSEPMVLVSDLAETADINFLKVRLIGTESNRDGLGARVTVFAGDNSYLKVHDGKSGYLSQSSYPLYFGLGDATAVDRVEVVWPSGKRQTVPGPIAANQTREITED